MAEKLIVLSMDAMVSEDIEYLKTKPNFARLFAKCAQVEKMCTVYPSLTYPAHVSMRTGCKPGRTGVYTNSPIKLESGPTPWHLWSDLVQVEDIFDEAKRLGKTTASVYWPITGKHPHIDYNINEYFFPHGEPMEEGFAAQGASEATLVAVRENADRFPKTKDRTKGITLENTYDHFINGCVCSLIRLYQPDLLLAHNCYLDTTRHRYGVFTPYTTEGLDYTDMWLGEIIEALEEAGIYDETNFILLSDHGQRDFVRRMKPNVLLRRAGYIDVDENEKVTDWRAICQSNGMSAYVYVKDEKDCDGVRALIDSWIADGVWGVGKVRTVEECRRDYGLWGEFTFMLETDGYSTFAGDWKEPVVAGVNLSDYRLGAATHGYEPETGAQPVFVGRGPAFKEGAFLPSGSVLDEAPTMAAILGGQMPDADGKPMWELLAER